jgi:hypothetical protein
LLSKEAPLMATGAELGLQMLGAVKAFVARSLGILGEQVTSLASRIDVLEKRDPVPGPQGERGEQGAKGERGEDGEPGAQGEAGAAGRDGKDGADGKDGGIGPQGAAGPPGKAGETGPAGTVGPQGASGRDGRDALQLEILSAVDPERRYARNTYARHAGGLIHAFRDTDAITLAEIERSGWEAVWEGVAGVSEEVLDEGRRIRRTTTLTSGKTFTCEHTTSYWIDRGVWREGMYQTGDVVTWGGSSFVAQRETTEKPDPLNANTGWRLIAKRGRDGDRSK